MSAKYDENGRVLPTARFVCSSCGAEKTDTPDTVMLAHRVEETCQSFSVKGKLYFKRHLATCGRWLPFDWKEGEWPA